MEIRKMPKADIEMGYEDGRLVQVTIKTTVDDEDGQLGHDELIYAARQIQDFARFEHRASLSRSTQTSAGSASLKRLLDAYSAGNGRVTDEYLARLAVAYGELAPGRRDVSSTLAAALGKPLQTVKGHIMRARREGWLTEAAEGREGGEPTEKARKLIART